MNIFEIQPITDITKLPEHYYLPFHKAKYLVESLLENELYTCLKVPDFLCQQINLDFIHEDKPDTLKDQNKLHLLSEMIGVSVDQLLNYIHKKRRKRDPEKWKKGHFTKI